MKLAIGWHELGYYGTTLGVIGPRLLQRHVAALELANQGRRLRRRRGRGRGGRGRLLLFLLLLDVVRVVLIEVLQELHDAGLTKVTRLPERSSATVCT